MVFEAPFTDFIRWCSWLLMGYFMSAKPTRTLTNRILENIIYIVYVTGILMYLNFSNRRISNYKPFCQDVNFMPFAKWYIAKFLQQENEINFKHIEYIGYYR